jgi:hypothetical protein
LNLGHQRGFTFGLEKMEPSTEAFKNLVNLAALALKMSGAVKENSDVKYRIEIGTNGDLTATRVVVM